MEARQRAMELINEFDHCKGYAVKSVEMVIAVLDDLEKTYSGVINNSWGQDDWIEVKEEINKL